jgi:hypothetical protein
MEIYLESRHKRFCTYPLLLSSFHCDLDLFSFSATTKVVNLGTTTFSMGTVAVMQDSILVALIGDTHVRQYTSAGNY